MSVYILPSSLRQCLRLHRRHSVVAQQQRWQSTALPPVSSRFLSDAKQRIGHCITFGLEPAQTAQAGYILQEISRNWRELIAGSEGFLTGANRRGLFRQEVVWGEQDSMGHVNNVVYNRYAESGRLQWAQQIANHVDRANQDAWKELWTPKGVGLILRSITTEFKFPMKWPDCITVYHKLRTEPGPGTDSFILDVVILSELHQRPAARCVEDIVVYDYIKEKKAPLKPFMTDVFEETWRLQEETKEMWRAKAADLLEQVTRLEKESWDRKGAVEDMGGT